MYEYYTSATLPGLFDAAGPQTVLTQQRQHLFEASVRQFVATLTGPRIKDGNGPLHVPSSTSSTSRAS